MKNLHYKILTSIMVAMFVAATTATMSALAEPPKINPKLQVDPKLLRGLENAQPEIRARIVQERQTALQRKWHFTPRLTKVSHRPLTTLAGSVGLSPRALSGVKPITEQGLRVVSAYRTFLLEKGLDKFGIAPNVVMIRCQLTDKTCDWSALGMVTPPATVGQGCGDCWAWATTANIESAFLMAGWPQDMMSQQEIQSCSGADTSTTTCSYPPGGNAFDAVTWAVSNKEATLASYPYDNGKHTACRANIAGKYQLISVGWVNPSNPGAVPSVAVLKKALVEFGPLTIAIYADPALMDFGVADDPTQPTESGEANIGGAEVFDAQDNPVDTYGNPNTNHSVLLVGWDDNKGAWKIKNSWSTGWGDGGYGWIQYGSNNIGAYASWAVAPAHNASATPNPIQRDIVKLTTIISSYHPNVIPLPNPGPDPGPIAPGH